MGRLFTSSVNRMPKMSLPLVCLVRSENTTVKSRKLCSTHFLNHLRSTSLQSLVILRQTYHATSGEVASKARVHLSRDFSREEKYDFSVLRAVVLSAYTLVCTNSLYEKFPTSPYELTTAIQAFEVCHGNAANQSTICKFVSSSKGEGAKNFKPFAEKSEPIISRPIKCDYSLAKWKQYADTEQKGVLKNIM